MKLFLGISVLFVFSLLFTYFFHPIPLDILNNDLGRHIVLGEIIVNSWNVPTTNLLSYTYPDYPFINTHWLSGVLFYFVQRAFGFDGLLLIFTLMICIAFGVLFYTSSKKFGIAATLFISFFYLQLFSARTQIRPELFSFLFLTIFIVLLYKNRQRYTPWIYIIILLQLLWVNLHIYFFVGIATLFLFLLDTFIQEKYNFHSKKARSMLLVTIGALLGTIINPNVFNGAIYPLFVLNNYGVPIKENINFSMQ